MSVIRDNFAHEIADATCSSPENANYLLISALDYRTPRKANLHFIADELAKRGTTRFFSLRYSSLSRFKADPRLSIDDSANRIESFNGVECYLWKTLVHPFNTRHAVLKPFEALMYEWYRARPPKTFVKWVRQADFIFLESGIAPIFFDLISRANPRAETIYIASDDLSTIRVADFVHKCFNEAAPKMSALCLPSRALADNMPSSHNKFYVPHGIDLSIKNDVSTNPYVYGINAVSVGSMLFDPEFFVAASKSFPNITFHVIGSGHPPHPEYGRNVKVYDEMPYRQTLRYIKHATFGIAPYSAASVPAYLADTSMKLMQYDFFGLPAICPQSVVGRYSTRFGYTPGDADSIRRAIQRALRSKRASVQKYLSWSDVTSRLLTPGRFSDTRI